MGNTTPPSKGTKVWISCRATAGCAGTHAEIVNVHSRQAAGPGGSFTPIQGGRFIRYKCLTCGKSFHVSQ